MQALQRPPSVFFPQLPLAAKPPDLWLGRGCLRWARWAQDLAEEAGALLLHR